jgi:hypothetical protein
MLFVYDFGFFDLDNLETVATRTVYLVKISIMKAHSIDAFGAFDHREKY